MMSNHSGAEISAELAATANEPQSINLNSMSYSHHQSDSSHLLDTNKHFLTKIIHQQFNPSTSSLPSLLVRSLVALNEATSVEQVAESSLGSSSSSSSSSNSRGSGSNSLVVLARNETEYETSSSSFLISKTSNQPPQQLQLLSTTATDELDGSKQLFSNRWNEYWSKEPFPSGYTQSSITLLACLITTIIFLIVVGNLLVCIAIFTEKSLKPTQNWFIASLAVSDMMLGLVVMPFSLARELMGFWVFGQLWCDIHEAIDVLLTTASINTLCLISLDRYWSITQAVSYLKKRTPRRGAFMIAFVWIFSAAVSLPPLFGWRKQQESVVVNITSTAITESASLRNGSRKSDTSDEYQPTGADSELLTSNEQAATDTRARRRRTSTHRHRPLAHSSELATPHSNRPEQLDDARWLAAPNMRQARSSQQQFYADEMNSATPPPTSTILPTTSPTPTTIEYPQCQLSDDIGYVLYSALGSFYIPCAVMVFTYIKIFLAARSRARRAISKQSRSAQSSKPRGRRTTATTNQINNSQQPTVPQTTTHPQTNIESNEGSTLVSAPNKAATQTSASSAGDFVRLDPPPRGKIVIVERRKSLAIQAGGETSAGKQQSMNFFQTPTYTTNCFALNNDQLIKISEDANNSQQLEVRSSSPVETNSGINNCILTTSGARQASRSCLNSSPSNDSSMITVMNASMGELPVTRFNFHTPTSQATSVEQSVELDGSMNKCDSKESNNGQTALHDDSSKAAALLRAISQVAANSFDQEEQVHDTHNSLPDIQVVVDGTKKVEQAVDNNNNNHQQQINTTNETCFMTIEEDSDMFDAQTGRTIVLVASVAPSQQKQQINRQPQNEQVTTCGAPSAICRRHHTRSGSSYCDSSMTINDDDEDLDECGEVDDDLLTDECNGYSISCNLDQYSTCPQCQQCHLEELEDHGEDDDVIVDDEVDNVGEFDVRLSSSDMMMRAENGIQPVENIRRPNDLLVQIKSGPVKQQSEQLKLSPKHQHQHHHHHYHHHQHQQENNNQHQHRKQSRVNSETEAHSIMGDDNLSVTDYRSNEDGSSIMGHDVLDATERPSNRASNKKKNSMAAPTSALPVGFVGERKKSYIGFRLSRLASSAPLTAQAGGLLDLAISSQQQSVSNSGTGVATSGGPRNLKALRQNFFMKLNQLTAKSASKQQERKSKRSSLKMHHGETSPTGKSSAHSSGTSFEPSVDCATTSNVHSAEYPQDTTTLDESNPCEINKKSNPMTTDSYERERIDNCNSQNFNADKKSTYPSSSGDCGGCGGDGGGGGAAAAAVGAGIQSEKSALVESKIIRDGVSAQNKASDDKTLLLHDHPSPSIISDSNKTGQRNSLLSSNNSTILPSSNGKPMSPTIDQQSKQPQLRNKTVKTNETSRLNHTSSAKMHLLNKSQNAAPSSVTNRAYLASDNERHKRKLAKARERRATLILGLIMAAFICSWLPFFTFYVLRALCHVCREYISARFESFIFWMGYCNSAINPIIYTIFNRDFRKAFRKILFKCL